MKGDNLKSKLILLPLFLFSLFLFTSIHSASADITANLVSHYKLDETSGTTAADSAGANNGTLTNGPTWTTGKIGNGLSFDGVNDYVNLGTPYIGNGTAFTISMWIKISSTQKGKVYTEQGAANVWNYLSINENIAGDIEWGMSDDTAGVGGAYPNPGAINLNNGQWHHIVAVQRSKSDRELYVDNVSKVTNTTLVGTFTLTAGSIGSFGAAQFFTGGIDDVRIYSRALSAADIADLYNSAGTSQSSSAVSSAGTSSAPPSSSSSSATQSSSAPQSVPPTATTNSATSLTSTSATLNATVNNNGLTTTAYFQYGLTSAYGNQTPSQTVSNLGDIAVSSSVSNLSPNTVYYYRVVAQSNGGTSYGTQMSFTTSSFVAPATSNGWKNFFAVCWVDVPENHIKYAKQMGYDYIGINDLSATGGYSWIANRAGLKFYFVNPLSDKYYLLQGYNPTLPYPSNRSYTTAEKNFFEQYMAWKSTEAFPYNLATGWFDGAADRPYGMLDLQQQAVIDYAVAKIIERAHAFENTSIGFTFAGVIFDVPRLWGDFHIWSSGTNEYVNLGYWNNGSNSSKLHSGITHEYATYSDGLAAFFKALNTRMKQEFPTAKWIMEPAKIYNVDWDHADGWVEEVMNRSDKNQLVPDFLSQEFGGTEFVDDARNFTSGLNITKDMVGSTQQLNWSTDTQNRVIAGKASINGAWYNWFGRLGAMSIRSVTAVSPSLLLIRMLPNWDNLNNIPLASRSWNGSVYQSTKSYASGDVIYSRHWKTGKLFGVFLTTNGVIRLNSGETVTSTQRTDGYFIESGDGSTDVSIVGSEIRLKSSTNTNKGYIFTVSSSATNSTDTTSPTVTITSPTTGATYSTTQSTVSLSGTASDNTALSSVTCSVSTGATCSVSGTTNWTISNMALSVGNNIITVTARDSSNNLSTKTLTVTRTSTISSSSSSSAPQSSSSSASLPTLSATAKKTLSPITLDGNLNESGWSLDQSVNRILSGTSNNTATFGVLYDDNYLYVGVKVLEANLTNDSADTWQDDSVEIYLDANNNKGTTYDSYDRQIIKGWNDPSIFSRQSATGVLHSYSNITGGYTVELAIPWTNLGVDSAAGRTLGLDVQINDDDNGADRDNFVTWNNGVSNTNPNTTVNFGSLTLSSQTAGTTQSSSSSSIQSSSSSSASLPTLSTTAKKTLSNITLDGNLNESVWNLTESMNRSISGINNNTATFSTLWNNQYLYVGIKVLDSVLKNDSTNSWQDDSIEVYLDGAHNHATAYDLNDRHIIKGWNDSLAVSYQLNTPNLIHGWSSITGGYSVELAIPWSDLGVTPSANMTVGFDLQQNDDDNGADREGFLSWNDATGLNPNTTANFGHLVLSATTIGTLPSSSSSSVIQPPSSSSQSSSSISLTKFKTGDRVLTTANLNVHSTASLSGTNLGIQTISSLGAVVSGPVSSGGYNWYNINFDTAPDGWSAENYLEKTEPSSSSSSVSSSAAQTSQPSAGNTGSGGGGGGGGGTYTPSFSYGSALNPTASTTASSTVAVSPNASAEPFSALKSVFQPIIQTIAPLFTQPLSFGLRSDQVKTLQEMLSTDRSIYPERLVTGYYGQLTKEAVKRFQAKHNLETTGLVDLKTRAKLNEIYGSSGSTNSKQTPTSSLSATTSLKQTSYSSLTEAQRQELIKQLQETLKKLMGQLIELLKKKAGR